MDCRQIMGLKRKYSLLTESLFELARNDNCVFVVQIVGVYVLWLISSTCQSIVNKMALNEYPYPLTIALSSLLNNVIYAYPLLKILHIVPVRVSANYMLRTVVPISLGRATAVSFAYLGLSKVPISYAQTVKATMPVFTVLISRMMLNEKQSGRVYASLAPILFGVVMASATEIQFDSFGLFSSLLSTFIFAFLNVLAKKVFEETGMHPIVLLSLNSQLASVVLFPVWLLRDGYVMWSVASMDANNSGISPKLPDFHFLFFLLLSGVCSFAQNWCAFALIHQLTTLSYAVSNATKKIFVILLSLLALRNPVTPMNLCGMMITILGVFVYNRVKSREKADKKQPSVPTDQKVDGEALLRRHGDKLSFDVGKMHSSSSDVRLLMSFN